MLALVLALAALGGLALYGYLQPTVFPAGCSTTVPNNSTPPGETATAGYHGNGKIWTALWADGQILARGSQILPDGSIKMKFPWWRGKGVVGILRIESRRLDGASPPASLETQDDSQTEGFQPSYIIFPAEGCWEITATVGTEHLTVVQHVAIDATTVQ